MVKSSSQNNRKRKLESQDGGSSRAKVAKEEEGDAESKKSPFELKHVEGTVYVIGQGDCGQLGLGEDIVEKLRPGPVQLPNSEKVSLACAGGMHTVCVTTCGKVYSWGVNDEGALGRFTEGEAWKKAPKPKGSTPGDPYKPGLVQIPKTCSKIVGLSAGDSHTMILDDKGAVYGWGTFRDSGGVMGFKPDVRISVSPVVVWSPRGTSDQVVKISSGTDHVLALCRNNAVLTWGSGQQGQLGRVGTRVARRGHTLLDAYLNPAQMHLPFHLRKHPVDVEAGHYASYVVLSDGEVYSCGLNNYGQLGIPSSTTDMVNLVPKKAVSLQEHKISAIAAGQHHAIALTMDSKILAWGRPAYGRLGREDVSVDSDSGVDPGVVALSGTDAAPVGIAAGVANSGCFTDEMCGLWLCGFGETGQLAKGDDDGDENTMAKVKRTKAFNEVKIERLEFGGQHVVLLTTPFNAQEAVVLAADKEAGKKNG